VDFADLKTELAERGFDYLSDARLARYINLAYHEVCEQALWPFLQAESSGTAPLVIANLRMVESVEDSTNQCKLAPIDRRALTDGYPGLPDTGSPSFYYFTGQTALAVYPASDDAQITVRYWRSPADLSDDADEPAVPTRYQYAIVDYAVARAASDNGEPDKALAARQEGDRLVEFMLQSLIDPQADRSSLQALGDGTDW
jgi:hypothetical protein